MEFIEKILKYYFYVVLLIILFNYNTTQANTFSSDIVLNLNSCEKKIYSSNNNYNLYCWGDIKNITKNDINIRYLAMLLYNKTSQDWHPKPIIDITYNFIIKSGELQSIGRNKQHSLNISPGEYNIYFIISINPDEAMYVGNHPTNDQIKNPLLFEAINTNSPPSLPTINAPNSGEKNMNIIVEVTVGIDPNGDQVKIACTGTNSNFYGEGNEYNSDWFTTGGNKVEIAFEFYETGEQHIYCVTWDEYGNALKDPAHETISINNSPPSLPTIDAPLSGEANKNIIVEVTVGVDPNGDKVQIVCTGTNSNFYGEGNEYNSDWFTTGGIKVEAAFKFYESGEQHIYCVTWDEYGNALKDPAHEKINILSENIQPIINTFISKPSSGQAPLSVILECKATDEDGFITKYHISFDDDEYEAENTNGLFTHTYSDVGRFNPICTAYDNNEGSIMKVIKEPIVTTYNSINQPPIITSFVSNPKNGKTPLEVVLECNAIDEDGYIEKYVINYDDGTNFLEYDNNFSFTHEYNFAGTFYPTCKVFDNQGGFRETTIENPIVVIDPKNENPIIISFTSVPSKGIPPLLVVLKCTAIDEDGFINNYEMNFGDESPLSENSNGTFTHEYNYIGDFFPQCKAIDNQGGYTSTTMFNPIEIVEKNDQPPVVSLRNPPDKSTDHDPLNVYFNWYINFDMHDIIDIKFSLAETDSYSGNIISFVGQCYDLNIAKSFVYFSNNCTDSLLYDQWYRWKIEIKLKNTSLSNYAYFKTKEYSAQLTGFEFQGIPEKTNVYEKFLVTIKAKDGDNNFTSFNELVHLTTSHTAFVTPCAVKLINGSWSGWVSIDAPSFQSQTHLVAIHDFYGFNSINSNSKSFYVEGNYETVLSYIKGTVCENNDTNDPPDYPYTVSLYIADTNQLFEKKEDIGNFTFSNLKPRNYYIIIQSDDYLDYKSGLIELTESPNHLLIFLEHKGNYPVILVPGITGSSIENFSRVPKLSKVTPTPADKLMIYNPMFDTDFIPLIGNYVGWETLRNVLTENDYAIFEAPWDWRLDTKQAWKNYLFPVIQKAKKETGHKKVNIVAHSMGGLIVKSYIQTNKVEDPIYGYNNDINKFAMVGTPHYGSAKTYYLSECADPYITDKIANDKAYFFSNTLKHLYYTMEGKQLFPTIKTCVRGACTTITNFEKLNIPRIEFKSWIKQNIKSVNELLPIYRNCLIWYGKEAIDFYYENQLLNSLNSDLDINNMDFEDGSIEKIRSKLFLSNFIDNTLKSIQVIVDEDDKDMFPYGRPMGKKYYDKGDGTVLANSFGLSQFFSVEISSKCEHAKMIECYTDDIVEFFQDRKEPKYKNKNLTSSNTSKFNSPKLNDKESQLVFNIYGRVQLLIENPELKELGLNETLNFKNSIPDSNIFFKSNNISGYINNPLLGEYTFNIMNKSNFNNEELLVNIAFRDNTDWHDLCFRYFCNIKDISFRVKINFDTLVLIPDILPPNNIVFKNLNNYEQLEWESNDINIDHFNVYVKPFDKPIYSKIGSSIENSFIIPEEYSLRTKPNLFVVVSANQEGDESLHLNSFSNSNALLANFYCDYTQGESPLTINFFDSSSGLPSNWEWDFNNDGIIDDRQKNPTYTYNQSGNFSVFLKISDDTNNDYQIKHEYIKVLVLESETTKIDQKDDESNYCFISLLTYGL